MADRKGNDTEALALLLEAGVIDRKATLDDLVRLSSRLEEISSGETNPVARWSFIVKGKFICHDDALSARA